MQNLILVTCVHVLNLPDLLEFTLRYPRPRHCFPGETPSLVWENCKLPDHECLRERDNQHSNHAVSEHDNQQEKKESYQSHYRCIGRSNLSVNVGMESFTSNSED